MELIISIIILLRVVADGRSTCCQMDSTNACRTLYSHYNEERQLRNDSGVFNVTAALKNSKRESLNAFFCIVFYPPCGSSILSLLPYEKEPHVVPCQEFCNSAWKLWRRQRRKHKVPRTAMWPWGLRCEDFPRERCVTYTSYGIWIYKRSKHKRRSNDVIRILKNDDDEFDVTPFSTTQSIPLRRYDVMDQGNAELFRGWADVQITGAANDYCRVIGKGKRQFLACALAGSKGQDHTYVSRMGFEPGLPGTWYMRDADGDGRDDYCRCIGNNTLSWTSCMKAEKYGFRSSPLVGGSQFSFDLIGSEGCYGQEVNPFTGV